MRGSALAAAFLCAAVSAAAQSLLQPSAAEQQSLMEALSQGNTSALDMIRAMEAHLARFPNSVQRAEIEQTLAKAAIDARDTPRIVKYGEAALRWLPEDILLLDRVTAALLATGGADAAERAYRYARAFQNIIERLENQPGPDAARRQEERDRALGRTLLYQSRARAITGGTEEAIQLAERSFDAYPNEESARELAGILWSAGRADEAITRMAEAFAIPDSRATEQNRLDDRHVLGQWYVKMTGSERGLGDVILTAYDRTAALVDARRKRLQALDPNSAAANAMDFTVTGLDGSKLRLDSLKGKVVVLDFWATWCVPCRVQHPLYETLRRQFPESMGVVFLAINTDQDRSLVAPFLEEQKWDKKVYFEDGLGRFLNVENIPTTILFDKSGRLASRMDGFDPDTFVGLMSARIQSLITDGR
jgi:thiol-disulfide isomerase/thioredoxin